MPNDQKNNQLHESVSALMDNQASPLEVQRILAHTEKNTGVRERWHRYHLARAVLRGESKGLSAADISDQVRAAVADLDIDFTAQADNASTPLTESTATTDAEGSSKSSPTWLAPFGRVAVAASVALAVLLGAQQLPLLASGNGELNSNDIAGSNAAYLPVDLSSGANLSGLNVQNVSSASFSAPDNRVQTSSDMQMQRRQQLAEEEVRQAIQRLMLQHAEQSSLDQSTGLMPFIRVSDSAVSSEASR